MAKINLTKNEDLYSVANKLAKAYANSFTPDTISRATAYVGGQPNPSRNYMWGVIANTQGKSGKLFEVYTKKTAESIVKLTIYGLAHNSNAQPAETDAF